MSEGAAGIDGQTIADFAKDLEDNIRAVRKRVTDGSILKLIRQFLTSRVMTDQGRQSSDVGSPQGGVISPLLANIYLDSFDLLWIRRRLRCKQMSLWKKPKRLHRGYVQLGDE